MNMNETTWKRVLEWEELHCDECTAARKLVRFVSWSRRCWLGSSKLLQPLS